HRSERDTQQSEPSEPSEREESAPRGRTVTPDPTDGRFQSVGGWKRPYSWCGRPLCGSIPPRGWLRHAERVPFPTESDAVEADNGEIPVISGPEVITCGEAMLLMLAEPGVPLDRATNFRRSVAGAESNVAAG